MADSIKKMTASEKLEWNELFQYFKVEIMGYNDKKLPQFAVLRLRGLAEGKFMSNKKITPQASYTFKEILLTLKLCKSTIDKYFMNNNGSFSDERHKINGVFVIVESEINNTKDMMDRCRIAKEKIEIMDVEHYSTDEAEYKTKGKVNTKLKELW